MKDRENTKPRQTNYSFYVARRTIEAKTEAKFCIPLRRLSLTTHTWLSTTIQSRKTACQKEPFLPHQHHKPQPQGPEKNRPSCPHSKHLIPFNFSVSSIVWTLQNNTLNIILPLLIKSSQHVLAYYKDIGVQTSPTTTMFLSRIAGSVSRL